MTKFTGLDRDAFTLEEIKQFYKGEIKEIKRTMNRPSMLHNHKNFEIKVRLERSFTFTGKQIKDIYLNRYKHNRLVDDKLIGINDINKIE